MHVRRLTAPNTWPRRRQWRQEVGENEWTAGPMRSEAEERGDRT